MKNYPLAKLIKKLGRRLGARVFLEPQFGCAGQIIFKNGVKKYFRNACLDINPLGASEIAKDKDYAAYFLHRLGYPTPIGRVFCTTEWAKSINSTNNPTAAQRYAKKIGWPIFVKPNSLNRGAHVYKVYNLAELKQVAAAISPHDNNFLIQKVVPGQDFRLVVLDNKLISAYQRLPLSINGDGRSTIRRLLTKKLKSFKQRGRQVNTGLNDPRVILHLHHLGLTWKSVPAKGSIISLLDNNNLSSGGQAIDVTEKIHPSWRHLAIKITRDMGLRLCGVDFIIQGGIDQPAKNYCVLEINASPGLNNYLLIGNKQKQAVEQLYLQVLRSLEMKKI